VNTIHLSETTHPPQQPPIAETIADTIAAIPRRAPRTSFADRIAMRIGLRLLLWSTRDAAPAQARQDRDLERIAREARAEHAAAIARAHVHGALPPIIR
jgi:hypothetical protein